MPALAPALQNSTEPAIEPWSVRPIAGIPSSAARSTSGPIRHAPSRIEYSLWTWRWAYGGARHGFSSLPSGGDGAGPRRDGRPAPRTGRPTPQVQPSPSAPWWRRAITVAPAMAAAAPPTSGIMRRRRRAGRLRSRAVLIMAFALRRTARLATLVPTTYVAYPMAAFRLLSIPPWYPFASFPNTTIRRVTAPRPPADDAGMNPNDTAIDGDHGGRAVRGRLDPVRDLRARGLPGQARPVRRATAGVATSTARSGRRPRPRAARACASCAPGAPCPRRSTRRSRRTAPRRGRTG